MGDAEPRDRGERRRLVAALLVIGLLGMAGVAGLVWRGQDLLYGPSCPSREWAAETETQLRGLAPGWASGVDTHVMDCDDNRAVIVSFFVSRPDGVADAVVRQGESIGWTKVVGGPSPCLEKVVAGRTTSLRLHTDPQSSWIQGLQEGC